MFWEPSTPRANWDSVPPFICLHGNSCATADTPVFSILTKIAYLIKNPHKVLMASAFTYKFTNVSFLWCSCLICRINTCLLQILLTLLWRKYHTSKLILPLTCSNHFTSLASVFFFHKRRREQILNHILSTTNILGIYSMGFFLTCHWNFSFCFGDGLATVTHWRIWHLEKVGTFSSHKRLDEF